jgi:hypothetical protein
VLSNRCQNLVINRDFVPRQYVEYAYPTTDLLFRKLLNSIPYALKKGHRLYREVFIEELPELARIPYFNTGLPISAPIEYWGRAKAIEAQNEQMYNELFYTVDKSFLYTRYYSNFDQWISGDAYWKNTFENIIYDSNAIIFKTILNQKYFMQLYEEHIYGKRNNRQKLVQAITLQKIMEYYDTEVIE